MCRVDTTKLHGLMAERGVKRGDLVQDGLSYSFIRMILSGERQPSHHSAWLLANRLGCDMADFVVYCDALTPAS